MLKGSQAAWPVGIGEAAEFPTVALCEGGPDLLAACHFIAIEGREADAAPVAMLGSSCGIHADALPLFAGKRVRIFRHVDESGDKAAIRWAGQLTNAGADVDALAFDGLRRVDNAPVNDLNDVARIHADELDAHPFPLPLDSMTSTAATLAAPAIAKPALAVRQPGPFRPEPTPPKTKPATAPANDEGTADAGGRVSTAGLVRIANLEAIEAVPLHYYAERSRWYSPNGQEGFGNLSDSQAKSLVAEYGFNKSVKDSQGNTPAERAMLWLTQNRPVHYAGPLAGHPAGCHTPEGGRILVTQSPRIITPKPGKCPTIRRLVESLLLDDKRDQISLFYLWLSESFAAFWYRMSHSAPWPFRHCPALAIFGPRGCGKTAVIDLVLTPLFGGRKADPMNYLRDPKFNKDLFAASLLALDDKGASANLADRRQRGEGLKDLIWKPEQRMEGKGADALVLLPFWRCVIAGNDDEAGLQVCPALSPSLEDKLLILRARPAEELPMTHEENDAWAASIRDELPAFASYLLAWRPPPGLDLDKRTRMVNFWHPELVAALRDMQPEMRLLELIDSLDLVGPGEPLWEGTASEFERSMRGKDSGGVLDRIFTTGTSAGRMLSELARMSPERVKKTDREGRSYYRIFRPK